MNSLKVFSLGAALFLLAACVTINIYFPSAEARDAAEKIVDDILGEEAKKPQAPGDNNQSQWFMPRDQVYAFTLLDLLIPPVEAAAQPKFDADTPVVRQLQASMKQRHAQLKGFFDQGAIGYTNNGLVAVRELSAVPLKQRGQLKNLVDAENQDRNAMYREIARANGHPEWEKDVRETFSRTWISNALKGWWYQNDKGQWAQK